MAAFQRPKAVGMGPTLLGLVAVVALTLEDDPKTGETELKASRNQHLGLIGAYNPQIRPHARVPARSNRQCHRLALLPLNISGAL